MVKKMYVARKNDVMCRFDIFEYDSFRKKFTSKLVWTLFVIFTVIFVMFEHKIKEGFVRLFSYIGWDPEN